MGCRRVYEAGLCKAYCVKSSLRSRFLAVCDISYLEMPSRVALLMVFLYLFVFYSFLSGLGYSLLMYFGREKQPKREGK